VTPKFLELLRALDRHRVAHVVVGGVAAILEGAPITTLDLDFVYRLDQENIKYLEAALIELSATYRDPAGRRILPTADRLRTHRVNLLETSAGLLDAMQRIGADWSYEDLLPRSHSCKVGELEVKVLDLAAVIESAVIDSTAAAGRDKDVAMLPVLRRALELRRQTGR
jgi:hypothetical protein